MKKETDKNKTTYEITINKKALLEVIEDLLKTYQANKKVKIVVI
jgi:hypothetical protein